jgi:tRNA 5-methylaminomethyl-2-thiouridine biosynthesis bifunctional protein
VTASPRQWGLQVDNCAEAWANQNAWRVLDASFGDGDCWREVLSAWRGDPRRPRLLHYAARVTPAHGAPANTSPDFQRQEFEDGRVLLTLFGGDFNSALRELRMDADTLLLPSLSGQDFTDWTAKLLARFCYRGTNLMAQALDASSVQALAAQGFELRQHAASDVWSGHYNPHWKPKARRQLQRLDLPNSRRCVVVGAGLAGASTAYALSRRGWVVQVLDAASAPAGGASSLPLGLMAPHTSADNNPRSRLTRAGVQMTTLHANRLLAHGLDWAATGVLTLKAHSAPSYCSDSAWVKPQALVGAWLAQPGIVFTGNAQVSGLAWRGPPENGEGGGGEWSVLAADGGTLASAPLVVLAAALGSSDILRHFQPKQINAIAHHLPQLVGVPGQVSWGPQLPSDTAWTPDFCVNGNGYLATGVPIGGQLAWLAGATFEDALAPLDAATAQRENFARLQSLLPGAAAALSARFEDGAVQVWRGMRCTTPDRLPLVGPAPVGAPGVWLNTGFGSRGLTWSVLCAELLAARLHGEPWPVAASLAKKLDYRVQPKPAAPV